PQARIISPSGSGSTLTTSAPRSPRIIAQKGPASARERSSTRIPSRGSFIPDSASIGQHLTLRLRREVSEPESDYEGHCGEGQWPTNGVGRRDRIADQERAHGSHEARHRCAKRKGRSAHFRGELLG